MLIRPQKKQAEHRRALIESVEVGDEVVTIGGIHGTVQSIDEEDMQLEIAPGTVVTFVKSAVARKVWDEEEEDALVESSEEDEA
jgi:preprotein translocase subunit YajC